MYEFKVKDAARIFFNRSEHWLHWREREHGLVADRAPNSYRVYSLAAIEDLALGLARAGAISELRYSAVLIVVEAMRNLEELDAE